MSDDEVPLRMGGSSAQGPVSGSMARFLQMQRRERAERDNEISGVEPDDQLLDGDEPFVIQNPIVDAWQQIAGDFYELCGFRVEAFQELCQLVEPLLDVPKRGRKQVIGPIDGFFLLLIWLRSAEPIDKIAIAFNIKTPTLYKKLHGVARDVHAVLVSEYIDGEWAQEHLRSGEQFPECGLVVDATVQKRGRPVGSFEEAKKYFSGKHWIYCLKSQVVTNRDGLAMHVVAGVPGAKHDLALFREHAEELATLVESRPREPTAILADKGYIGYHGPPHLELVTPHKQARRRNLTKEQRSDNK